MSPPERIHNVSCSQFSVARYYGGCTFGGHGYTYDPTSDTLIRDDVLRREEADAKRARQEATAAERAKWEKAAQFFDFGEEPQS